MKSEHLKKFKIPNTPGVYFFQKGKEILYIGKATSLRDRVRSYFGQDPEGKSTSYGAGLIETRGPLIVKMVQEADKIKWEITDSVLEALILEAHLIKKHQPYYNTKEKDDKSFLCVVITGERMPQVLTTRLHNLKEHSGIRKYTRIAKTYGPFTNGPQLREAMKIIRKIFPYIDAQSAKRDNFEFYRQLGLTPEIGTKEAQTAYRKNISNLKLFFQGKKKKIVSNLKKEMTLYAKNKEFECANEIKKRIFALTHINDIALIKNDSLRHPMSKSGYSRIEAYDIAHMSGRNMVGVMTVVEGGEMVKSEYKKFKIRTQAGSNDVGALKEVLERRLAHREWTYPNLIVVDGGTAQVNIARKILKNISIDIPVVSVVKDDRHRARGIMGDKKLALKYEREILLANSEAHRFAVAYHKNVRGRNFLK